MKKDASYDWLVDSAAFVALHFVNDPHHVSAHQLFEQAKQQKLSLVTTSYIVSEAATVLSNRQGQDLARQFLDLVENIPTIFVTEELHKESVTFFRHQQARGTSVVDCSNVVIMKHYDIPTIFSFDEVFSKRFNLKAA